jgi:RsiW-degrading membrane proteinase PrsW (M82 family)
MKYILKIRLSLFFWMFLVLYGVLVFTLPHVKFDSAALTLFSVNSFLYGFYIGPILSGQKSRIEELHRIVRSEANAVFAMALTTNKFPDKLHKQMVGSIKAYVSMLYASKSVGGGEKEYEELIKTCVNYKGDEQGMGKLLDQLVANQTNRSNLALQMANKVFSNEWWIMLVLFSITLSFVLLLDVGGNPLLKVIKALLCTGLSMLLTILVKLSTLTHKKAKSMWDPLKKLIDSNFYRID